VHAFIVTSLGCAGVIAEMDFLEALEFLEVRKSSIRDERFAEVDERYLVQIFELCQAIVVEAAAIEVQRFQRGQLANFGENHGG
jgi:hypothetical protein